MSQSNNLLPALFVDLEIYSSWIHADEVARRKRCVHADMQEIQAFYDAMLARMDAVIEYLNQYPLEALAAEEKNLLLLVQAFVEASVSVEMFAQPEIEYGMPIERFQPMHHLAKGK